MNTRAGIRFVGRRLAQALWRKPGNAWALLLGFAASALIGTLGLCAARLSQMTATALGQDVHVVAYLDRTLSDERARALAVVLSRLPGIGRAQLVTAAEAASRLRAAAPAGTAATLTAGLEAGFFPRSIEIALSPLPNAARRLRDIEIRLRRLPGVVDLDTTAEGLALSERWHATLTGLARVAPPVAASLCVALLALLVARSRARSNDEVRVLLLVGHTPAALRIPAALVGLVCAGLGGAAGLALAAWALRSGVALGVAPFNLLPEVPPLALAGRDLAVAAAVLCAAGLIVGMASLPLRETARA